MHFHAILALYTARGLRFLFKALQESNKDSERNIDKGPEEVPNFLQGDEELTSSL